MLSKRQYVSLVLSKRQYVSLLLSRVNMQVCKCYQEAICKCVIIKVAIHKSGATKKAMHKTGVIKEALYKSGAIKEMFLLINPVINSKTCLKQPLRKNTKIGFQYRLLLNSGQKYCRMLHGEHSAILSTFIKLPFSIKIFVLSIFKWLLKTGFTVLQKFNILKQEKYVEQTEWGCWWDSGEA